MNDSKLLPKVYWGCGSAVHNGWLIIGAETESAARSLVDSVILRDKARVVKVTKFTKEDIELYRKHVE